MRDETLWALLQAYGFPMGDGRSLAAQIAADPGPAVRVAAAAVLPIQMADAAVMAVDAEATE